MGCWEQAGDVLDQRGNLRLRLLLAHRRSSYDSLKIKLRVYTFQVNNSTPVTRRQSSQLTTTNAVEINRQDYGVNTVPVWEQLATDQTDPWQVVRRQVFTPYDYSLTSIAFVVLCRVSCLWVTGVSSVISDHYAFPS